MIINTGQRTDIPAFYTPWFLRRIAEGHVVVRSPYDPGRLTRYRLSPDVVDVIGFCTKNPAPLLPHWREIAKFRQLWHVTITPYGRDIEPHVPPVSAVIDAVRQLARFISPRAIFWRYDPIFISEAYPVSFHLAAFESMARALAGSTRHCIISFIDLYKKTRHNFPKAREVPHEVQQRLASSFVQIGQANGMEILSCLEDHSLSACGVNTGGCLAKEQIEKALAITLRPPSNETKQIRAGCDCLLSHDIGAYNSCAHLCRYCYANSSPAAVRGTMARHDPRSPLLIGRILPGEIIHEARQESWIPRETSLF